ncbi:DUF3575 domain-containing protein [Pontibacter oryzae]|uniref:DUF3575 domain-containing protein n=1 Tax=Pontibacter oryzae TaxID=2304593 RepID=A0A399S4K8_9BACT|nr:DUF3575 domain-containing protein [Pontibacter oryzae]RIJ37674.1 DUF3575 domain-containing protein [Pontibacter oryzae]
MKKITLLLLIVCLLGFTSAALAQVRRQAPAPRRAVIKANVLSPFVLTASGFVEYAFTPQISGQFGAFTTGASYKDVDFEGYGFTPEVRYYLSDTKQAPNGFYVAGYGRILNYKLTVEKEENEEKKTYTATYAPVGAGVAAGNQFIFNSGISLDLFMGVGVNGGSLKVNSGTEEDFDLGFLNLVGSGVRFRPGITVGYSF